MENKIIQIQGVSVEDLTDLIKNSIRTELVGIMNQNPISTKEKLLSRKEVLTMLKISEVTLWNYEKQGKIKGYGIGGRRLYKESEILDSLQEKL